LIGEQRWNFQQTPPAEALHALIRWTENRLFNIPSGFLLPKPFLKPTHKHTAVCQSFRTISGISGKHSARPQMSIRHNNQLFTRQRPQIIKHSGSLANTLSNSWML
jgi:hypothetical protein